VQDTDAHCRELNGFSIPNAACVDQTLDGVQVKSCRPNELPPEQQPAAAPAEAPGKSLFFIPNIGIPGSAFSRATSVEVTGRTLGDFVAAFYVWFAGAAAVLAIFMVMFGGYQWLTAAGNAGRIGQAKETITGAVVGLVLLLTSYVLLATISPTFVNFKDLRQFLTPISPLALTLPERFGIGISEIVEDAVRQTVIGRKDFFNRSGCPTPAEMKKGFQAFLTGYYRPDLKENDSGGYKNTSGQPDPMCNVAMQCICGPTDAYYAKEYSCTATGYSKKWRPCLKDKLDPESYCTKTASGRVPEDLLTAAASGCFGFGTKFTISGGQPFTDGQEWEINDRGGDIRGRHFDLYTGTGAEAKRQALLLRSEVTIVVTKFCPNARGAKCGPP
jgi:3D (Asp-Asp-Asp) domain-containing protein